jgi:hypothetical protein
MKNLPLQFRHTNNFHFIQVAAVVFVVSFPPSFICFIHSLFFLIHILYFVAIIANVREMNKEKNNNVIYVTTNGQKKSINVARGWKARKK